MKEYNYFAKNASFHSTDDDYGFEASTKLYEYGSRKILSLNLDVLKFFETKLVRSKFSNIMKENKI